MRPEESSTVSSDHSDFVRRSQVEEIVNAKIGEYKRIIRAFLLGFGILFVVLITNRLISQHSLLVYLHDEMFGSERYLGSAINKSVALSYSNEFALDSNTPYEYLSFYANDPQTVIALIEVKHHGASSPNEVLVRLDQIPDPVWRGSQDLDFNKLDLTDQVRKPAVMSSPADHVHNLTFQISRSNPKSDDHVHVRVLVNVIGLEQKLP